MMSLRVQQYSQLPSTDKKLMERIHQPATLTAFGKGDAAADVSAFITAAKAIFSPSPQHCTLIRSLVSDARGHAERNFSSGDDHFVERLYESDPWECLDYAVCLTGLSGCGKSHLLRAVGDALKGPAIRIDVGSLKNLPIEPLWSIKFAKGSGLKDVLSGALNESSKRDGEAHNKSYSTSLALQKTRERTWRNGTALILPDELQFFVRGTESTTRVSKALLDLMSIGPLLTYTANFSLVHALKNRPSEDVERLLSKPLILHPDSEGCPYWISFIAELIGINPDIFSFTAEQVEAKVYRWTFGRRRAASFLFAVALKYGRSEARGPSSTVIRVKESTLERAYHSADYFVFRQSNELLFNQTAGDFRKRTDLWCPFVEPSEWTSIIDADHSKHSATVRPPSVESVAANAAVLSATTPAELEIVKASTAQAFVQLKPVGRPRIPRDKLTGDELIANIKQFEGAALERLR